MFKKLLLLIVFLSCSYSTFCQIYYDKSKVKLRSYTKQFEANLIDTTGLNLTNVQSGHEIILAEVRRLISLFELKIDTTNSYTFYFKKNAIDISFKGEDFYHYAKYDSVNILLEYNYISGNHMLRYFDSCGMQSSISTEDSAFYYIERHVYDKNCVLRENRIHADGKYNKKSYTIVKTYDNSGFKEAFFELYNNKTIVEKKAVEEGFYISRETLLK